METEKSINRPANSILEPYISEELGDLSVEEIPVGGDSQPNAEHLMETITFLELLTGQNLLDLSKDIRGVLEGVKLTTESLRARAKGLRKRYYGSDIDFYMIGSGGYETGWGLTGGWAIRYSGGLTRLSL